MPFFDHGSLFYDREQMDEGISHIHDHRVCWDCGGTGMVARSVSQLSTDQVLHAIGWRYLEPHGRMICPDCRTRRREAMNRRPDR